MCGHVWNKIGGVQVCVKCGLTRTADGKILFDRKLPNYHGKGRKKNGKK